MDQFPDLFALLRTLQSNNRSALEALHYLIGKYPQYTTQLNSLWGHIEQQLAVAQALEADIFKRPH